MQSPQHPLEVLPAMLNLVLLQTAKILRDPECRNPKQASLTKRRITEIVTVANQRYHDALDEIEIEILRAKAVMERDLRLYRRQRAEEDRANGKLAEPSPTKEQDEILPNDSTIQADAMILDGTDINPKEFRLDNELATEITAGELKEVDAVGPQPTSQEAINTEQRMPQDSDNSMGLAITIPSDDTNEASQQPKSSEMPADFVASTEAPIEIPPDAVDLDFESMFNDTDPKAVDNALNFDFELPNEAAMTHDIMNNDTFNDINLDNANSTDLPTTTNEDIDSLLPGVENYLNADADFSNIAIPPQSSLPENTQPATTSTTTTSAQDTAQPAVADTSFDDNFFGLGGFDVGETGGDELGDGTLGDFEDFDWS
ncbi:hypothetical protein ACLMJK_000800 [Lecanora helva]